MSLVNIATITRKEVDELSLLQLFSKYFSIDREALKITRMAEFKEDNSFYNKFSVEINFSYNTFYNLLKEMDEKYTINVFAVGPDKSFRYFSSFSVMLSANEDIFLWIIRKDVCPIEKIRGYKKKEIKNFKIFKVITSNSEAEIIKKQPQDPKMIFLKIVVCVAVILAIIIIEVFLLK